MVKRERHDIYGMERGAFSADSRRRELWPLHHVRRVQRRRRAGGEIRRGRQTRSGRYDRPSCDFITAKLNFQGEWCDQPFFFFLKKRKMILDEIANATAVRVNPNFPSDRIRHFFGRLFLRYWYDLSSRKDVKLRMNIVMESFSWWQLKYKRRGPAESWRERVPARNYLTAGLMPAGRVCGSSGWRLVLPAGDGIRASDGTGRVRELQRRNRG